MEATAQSPRGWWRRELLLCSAGAGLMALLLVISGQDLARTGALGGHGVGSARFDAGVQREVMLSKTAPMFSAGHQMRQSLLDAQDMHNKLTADLNALDRIIGKQASTHTSSLLKTSLSSQIIAQAQEVKKQAAVIAGKDKSSDDAKNNAITMAAANSGGDKDVVTKAGSEPVANPFANDKKWSISKEGEDMDNFFDSLDSGAAVKEARVRKEHQERAAKLVHLETKQEKEAEMAAERKANAKARLSHRHNNDRTTVEFDNSARNVKSAVTPKAGEEKAAASKEAHVTPASTPPKDAKETSGQHPRLEQAAPHDAAASASKTAAVVHVSEHAHADADADAAAHKNRKMSAAALRKDEEAFYNHLSGGVSGDHEIKDTKNKKITDKEERDSVEKYFDKQIQGAEAGDRLKATKSVTVKLSSASAHKDMADYWKQQGVAAKNAAEDTQLLLATGEGEKKMTTREASEDLNKYFDADEDTKVPVAPKQKLSAVRSVDKAAAEAKEKKDVEGVVKALGREEAMPGDEASKDINGYYNKLVKKATDTKARDVKSMHESKM